jgi:hypothetical protein
MKKIFGLTILLVAAAACSTGPATNTPSANTNSATAAKSPPTAVAEADITAKEKATWEALKKKDFEGFGEMLASDYLEVGGEGVFDKEGIIKNVKDMTVTDVTFSDWKFLPVDKDTALLTYQVTIKGTAANREIPPGPYRAGSAWQNRDGKWVVVYYQETLAAKPPSGTPPPPPAKAASPAASASPAAASTPGVPGPDPVANEKLVWDALKSKHYDQFAALLAPDSIEVEPDGVYDKSASVKGVSSVDLSKAQLSEWKTVKLDNDAVLVTYLVTDAVMKPSKQRHSTVWINRDGKWLALYHHGTNVEAMPPPPPAKTKATK